MRDFRFFSMVTLFSVFLGCVTSHQASQDVYLTDQGLKELKQGNYQQAEANLLVALDLNPNNPFTLLYLGEVYQKMGRIEKARQMYKRVVHLNPHENAPQGNAEYSKGKSLAEVARVNLEDLEMTASARILKDSDLDGVPDDSDRCPGTPESATVNHLGCWVLKGPLFDRGQWNINPQAHPALDGIVSILQDNPKLKLEVQGHTDNRGSAKHNQHLSELRARVIRGYLVKNGVDGKRLTWVGYGFSKPIASNDTPEGRAQNRRVELRPICE